MKKLFKGVLFFLTIFILQGRFVYGQNSHMKDSMTQYYNRLATSDNKADKALLQKKLYELLKSDDEKDWITATRYFYQLKKKAVVDSIKKAEKIKFPQGRLVRNEQVRKVYNEKDAVKKEQLFEDWIKRFPPEKFGSDRIVYDYARNSVAHVYAVEDNVAKALQYANSIETQLWKGEGWAGIAKVFIQNNKYLDTAKQLLGKAIDNAYDYMTIKKNEKGAGFAASGYPTYCAMYAEIAYDQKKYTEALNYIDKAYQVLKDRNEVRGKVNAQYASILEAIGKNKEAFDKIDEALRAGQATPDMKKDLKALYAEVHGSEEGYKDYLEKVNHQIFEDFKKKLPRKMINKLAPDFTLKDLDGNTVSLSDYKGDIVVLDFWASWCGPCKASFPSMEMAISKYKKEDDVKFLFIHTWERGENATKTAKHFIKKNGYPFHVLMDLKDPKTGRNEVVANYKVTGIPTKFIIDKKGNIRFKFSGFSGGNDAAVQELSAMIELARK